MSCAAQPRSRQQNQRGSALLIVLVFAAIVAIMLYRELPVAAFEAQRQKEELLMFRGNEYKRAVKLFVRKVGRFPSSLDELESTNRMRFLRRRYDDPLTGKNDWRLIHAGPGGVIIDSKVQTSTKDDKNANALGQGATFKGFNNSFSGDAEAEAQNQAQNTSAAFRQRAPATKNASSQTPDPLALPPLFDDTANTPQNSAVVLDPATGKPVQNNAVGTNPGQPQTTQAANLNPMNPNTPGTPSAPNMITPGDGLGPVSPGISSVQDQLNTTNPRTPQLTNTPQQSAFANTAISGQSNSLTGTQGNGLIGAAGGIAGVASIAPGTSIKTVNDQTKYKLWEFFYDLRKDQSASSPGGVGGQQSPNNLNGTPGVQNSGLQNTGFQNNGVQTNNSAFGSGNNNTGFGFGQTQPTTPTQSGFGFSQPSNGFNQPSTGFNQPSQTNTASQQTNPPAPQ